MDLVKGVLIAQTRLKAPNVTRLLIPIQDCSLEDEQIHKRQLCVDTGKKWLVEDDSIDLYMNDVMRRFFRLATNEDLLYILDGIRRTYESGLDRALSEWRKMQELQTKEFERLQKFANLVK